MMKRSTVLLATFLCIAIHLSLQAQDRVGRGSTVQGDVLCGQGQFLKGAAWYELYSAQGRAIDADTERRNADWMKRSFEYDLARRAERLQRKHYKTQLAYENALREMEKKEVRLREAPNDNDVLKGDALNALLFDLSNPAVSPSSWRYARVDLPAEGSIRSLVFQFAPKSKNEGSTALSSRLIAMGRLDPVTWPLVLKAKELETERAAYEQAYQTVVAESRSGRLDFKAILKLDAAIAALDKQVRIAITKERAYQAKALSSLSGVKSAAKIFDGDSLDYASELIADTHSHDAHTVGELVAFMRKYRLVFASAEKSPADGEMYRTLFTLMREQSKKLNVQYKPTPIVSRLPPAKRAIAVPGTWLHTGGGAIDSERVLFPNGVIEMNGRVVGDWSAEGRRLTLRWPNARAPGGAWIDEVILSEDGKAYEGKNQKGAFIRGKRASQQ